MKNLVNEMVKVLEGRNVEELRNEVEQLRKLSQENRSKLMRKEIEREMYNTIEKSIDTQIKAYKKVLGENFPMFEIQTKSVDLKARDEHHIEEMLEDLRDDLRTLCKKRIEEMTGAYNEQIKRTNAKIKELEIELAGLLGEEFVGEFEAVEAMEEVAAVEEVVEVVEVEEVAEINETFTNNTSIRVPKKCRKMIDCLYKDIEGYRIELKEGYVFETTECGVECVDTQKEVLDLIKNYIIRG